MLTGLENSHDHWIIFERIKCCSGATWHSEENWPCSFWTWGARVGFFPGPWHELSQVVVWHLYLFRTNPQLPLSPKEKWVGSNIFKLYLLSRKQDSQLRVLLATFVASFCILSWGVYIPGWAIIVLHLSMGCTVLILKKKRKDNDGQFLAHFTQVSTVHQCSDLWNVTLIDHC